MQNIKETNCADNGVRIGLLIHIKPEQCSLDCFIELDIQSLFLIIYCVESRHTIRLIAFKQSFVPEIKIQYTAAVLRLNNL